MTEVDQLLAGNEGYVFAARARPDNAEPRRRLAVLTCMDTRVDPLAALGLGLGEAHVLRNAGGRVTDDVLRSLALSVHVLGVRTVVVMQHTRCGLAHVTNDDLRRRTGASLDFYPIADHTAALRDDVNKLAASEVLEPIGEVAGMLYDIQTGEVEALVSWRREV